MDIFVIENDIVKPTPEILLVSPFSVIWETKERGMAIIMFSYIEFMCSYKKKNPFIGYQDEERPTKILNAIFPDGTDDERRTVINDPLVMQGMKLYRDFQYKASPTLRFYEATLDAAEKMIGFFTTFDLTETNEKGVLLYKPADITRALKDTNEILRTLAGLKDKVHQELYDVSKGRGGREINWFEQTEEERKAK